MILTKTAQKLLEGLKNGGYIRAGSRNWLWVNPFQRIGPYTLDCIMYSDRLVRMLIDWGYIKIEYTGIDPRDPDFELFKCILANRAI